MLYGELRVNDRGEERRARTVLDRDRVPQLPALVRPRAVHCEARVERGVARPHAVPTGVEHAWPRRR